MDPRTIGILGGGQLGRMLVEAASRLNIDVIILDKPLDAPAKQLQATKSHIEGDFRDPDKIQQLAKSVDILTIEIEHVNVEILEKLAKEKNTVIHPSPATIKLIQDKFSQKTHLFKNNIPVVDFIEIQTKDQLNVAIDKFGYPFMLKSKTMAYDGRGNYAINSSDDIDKALQSLGNFQNPLYAEKWASFDKELAAIVVRRVNGNIKSYPVVETMHKENICHTVIAPALM
ncbi:7405_t:CDS:2 [Entrophospora sp. SA101]|nr:7405_t:CDS:2 [Entrophospora sp. SA101]